MRDGVVYELPMQVRPITDSESLLLRSPKASEGSGGAIGEAEALKRGNTVEVRDQVMDLVAGQGLKVSRVADNNSELFSTPTTMDARAAHNREVINKFLNNGNQTCLTYEVIILGGGLELMPTPTVGHVRNHDEPIEDYLERRQDYVDGKTKGMPGASLGVAVRMEMLPTPQALEGHHGNNLSVSYRENQGRQVMLSNHAVDMVTNWGKFEPAIRRWEALTRPAPAPTKPDGKDGNHRLSAEFTEWMMGLPEGWVTAPEMGLKRNDQLKACGNGVVPQQAEMALKILLQDINI
jgi:hypothetical protein